MAMRLHIRQMKIQLITRVSYILLLSEPKDKIAVRTPGIMKSPRKFSGVVIAMCGLPGRGKSQVAQCLSRRLNWNGESTKGWEFCFVYCRLLRLKTKPVH